MHIIIICSHRERDIFLFCSLSIKCTYVIESSAHPFMNGGSCCFHHHFHIGTYSSIVFLCKRRHIMNLTVTIFFAFVLSALTCTNAIPFSSRCIFAMVVSDWKKKLFDCEADIHGLCYMNSELKKKVIREIEKKSSA